MGRLLETLSWQVGGCWTSKDIWDWEQKTCGITRELLDWLAETSVLSPVLLKSDRLSMKDVFPMKEWKRNGFISTYIWFDSERTGVFLWSWFHLLLVSPSSKSHLEKIKRFLSEDTMRTIAEMRLKHQEALGTYWTLFLRWYSLHFLCSTLFWMSWDNKKPPSCKTHHHSNSYDTRNLLRCLSTSWHLLVLTWSNVIFTPFSYPACLRSRWRETDIRRSFLVSRLSSYNSRKATVIFPSSKQLSLL